MVTSGGYKLVRYWCSTPGHRYGYFKAIAEPTDSGKYHNNLCLLWFKKYRWQIMTKMSKYARSEPRFMNDLFMYMYIQCQSYLK